MRSSFSRAQNNSVEVHKVKLRKLNEKYLIANSSYSEVIFMRNYACTNPTAVEGLYFTAKKKKKKV